MNTNDTQDAQSLDPSPFRDVDQPTPASELRKQEAVARPKYWDMQGHARAQKLHNRGIWTDLGEKYGGLQMRLRPTFAHAVTVKREDTEATIRIRLGLADDEPIPAAENININRAAVNMAITAADGTVNISVTSLDPDDPDTPALAEAFDKMLSIAEGVKGKQAGMVVVKDGDLVLVTLSGKSRTDRQRTKEDPDGREAEYTREFFWPLLETSMPFLAALVRHTRGLQKVKDEDLNRLGEDFVFGQHVKDGWAD